MDESLPGPWNTYISARKEGTAGEGLKEKERGRQGGCVQFPRWRRNGVGSRWAREARAGPKRWVRWRRASDCACTRHTRKVDPHNDLVTNCLDRKYYRREPWSHSREKECRAHYARHALSPRSLSGPTGEETDSARNGDITRTV